MLPDREQMFVKLHSHGMNESAAGKKAGFHFTYGYKLIKKPAIIAALFEQHKLMRVQTDPTQRELIEWLAFEATYELNPASARIQAQKILADIKGMTGGGGNTADSGLDAFFRGAGKALVAGVFEGAKDAGRKLGEGERGAFAVEVSQGDGAAVVVDAKVVDDDMASAVPELTEEVK